MNASSPPAGGGTPAAPVRGLPAGYYDDLHPDARWVAYVTTDGEVAAPPPDG